MLGATLTGMLCAILLACGGGGAPESAASPAASPGSRPPAPAAGGGESIGGLRGGGVTAAEQHPIRGRIRAIPRDRRSVRLDHDAIPQVMAAMADMDYPVADPALLDGLAAGDEVEGRLQEHAGGYLVVALLKR